MNYKNSKIRLNRFILILLFVLTAVNSSAQDLVSLPQDAAIKTGTLPCGLNFFVVNNIHTKARADFALVQRTAPEQPKENLLDSSSRFPGGSIQSFLLRNGVGYGKDGYEIPNDFAKIYSFTDVDTALADSLILACMDIADRSEVSLKDQAVIISGDINAEETISRLKLMSYMLLPSLTEPFKDHQHLWDSLGVHKKSFCKVSRTPSMDFVEVMFVEPPMKRENVATVLPVVSERMAQELDSHIRHRLGDLLEKDAIPYSEIEVYHVTSESTLLENEFHLNVKSAPGYADKVRERVFFVLNEIDSGKIGMDEFNLYRSILFVKDRKVSSPEMKTNALCISKCIDSFICGASLASDQTRVDFLNRRVLPDTTRLRLFNNFADGVIVLDSLVCLDSLNTALQTPEQKVFSLDFIPGTGEKAKATKRTEPFSKGHQWIFPNGFRVVYLRQNTGGRLYYDLSLNGGLSILKNLKRGEASFIKDQLFLSTIGDIDGRRFRELLLSRDIKMIPEISCSDFTLRGEAPMEELQTLMGALLFLSSERTGNPDEFDYYLECERLRLAEVSSESRRTAVLDSIICSTNIYSMRKTPSALSKDVFNLSESFYEGHFRKMNDGMLVLVGDIHEDKVLSQIQYFAGRFRRQPGITKKDFADYRPISGTVTHTVSSEKNSVDVVCSVLQQFTAVNHAAADILGLALQDTLANALNGSGYYVRVSSELVANPREYLGLMIMADEASLSGLVEQQRKSPYEILPIINSAFSDFSLSEDALKAYKEILKHRDSARRSRPEYWPEEITRRYAEGKDITTKYQEKIDAVSAALVVQMAKSLYNGGKVEYINIK